MNTCLVFLLVVEWEVGGGLSSINFSQSNPHSFTRQADWVNYSIVDDCHIHMKLMISKYNYLLRWSDMWFGDDLHVIFINRNYK